MKLFLSQKKLDKIVQQAVLEDRAKFMEATARNAATNAIHYYVCWRPLSWWRSVIDEVEKSNNKYLSLAAAFTKMEIENDERKK